MIRALLFTGLLLTATIGDANAGTTLKPIAHVALSDAQSTGLKGLSMKLLADAGVTVTGGKLKAAKGYDLFKAKGKIFVVPVEKVYRIRTGEEDGKAVTPAETARA